MNAPDFSTHARRRRHPGTDQALVLVGVAALIVAATLAWRAVGDRDEARGRLAQLRQEIEPLQSRLRALEAEARRGGTVRSQAELTVAAPPPRVIADLAALLPGDTRLDRLELEYGETLELALDVAARSPAAYDRLLEALVGYERLHAVRSGPEDREGEIRARITARYLPAGEP